MKKLLIIILFLGIPLIFFLKKETFFFQKKTTSPLTQIKKEPLKSTPDKIKIVSDKNQKKEPLKNLRFDFSNDISYEKNWENIFDLKSKDELSFNIPKYGAISLKIRHSFNAENQKIVKGDLGGDKKGVFWLTSNEQGPFIGFIELTSENKFLKLIKKDNRVTFQSLPVSGVRCTDIKFASNEELKKAYADIYKGPIVSSESLAIGYLTNVPGHEPKIDTRPIDIHQEKQSYSYSSYSEVGKVLLLDFNGHEEPLNSPWGAYSKTKGYAGSPYDLDNDPQHFSIEEQKNIYRIWAFVAEKFYAFKINVTTDENVFNQADSRRRARMVVAKDMNGILGNSGGVAYLRGFGTTTLTTGWAVLDFTTKYPFNFATVISHEAGHQMGLKHDGGHQSGAYFQGISSISWGPVMGGGRNSLTVQWNNGTYADANNKEDDIRIMGGVLGYRPSDYFDYPVINNGQTTYPEIELNKRYPSFIAPHPPSPDGEIISKSVTLDHDYFKFSLNNQDADIFINRIQKTPTVILAAKLYKLDSLNNKLVHLDQYKLRGNKFSPSLKITDSQDFLIKVSPSTKSLKDVGYYGSIGQYTVEVKDLTAIESSRELRDDEFSNNTGDVPRISPMGRSISNKKEGQTTILNAVYYSETPIEKYQWRIYEKGEEVKTDNYLKILSTQNLFYLRLKNWMHNKVIKAMAQNKYGRGFSKSMDINLLGYVPSNGPPQIIKGPVEIRLNKGRDHNFKVVAEGSGLNYQWYKNGQILNNQKSAILSLYNLRPEDRGAYYVKVNNSRGSVQSDEILLNITGYKSGSGTGGGTNETEEALSFLRTPKGGTVGEGQSFSFMAQAKTSVSYQWFKNNKAISYKTQNRLILSGVTKNDEGLYFVEISKQSKKLRSPSVFLKVTSKKIDAPTLLKGPQSVTLKLGDEHKFEVMASGSGLQYQWMKNGGIIPGANSSFYFIKSVTKNDQSDYTVKVSNAGGSLITSKAFLTIKDGSSLKIVQNLKHVHAEEGESVQLPLKVEGGTGHYTYYWYKNNQFLKDTSYPYYNMSMVFKRDEGTYHGVVKDGTQEVTSSKVFLRVTEKKDPMPPGEGEDKEDVSASFVYCFCDKPQDDYYDLCIGPKRWVCQSTVSSTGDKNLEGISEQCISDVKGDLKVALKTLVKGENAIISRYEECFDYAHPFFEKEGPNSNCDGFEKDVVSFVGKENNFLKLKGFFTKPESLGFCLKDYDQY